MPTAINPYLSIPNAEFRRIISDGNGGFKVLKPNQHYDGANNDKLWHNNGKRYTPRGLNALKRQNQKKFYFFGSDDIDITDPSLLEALVAESANTPNNT